MSPKSGGNGGHILNIASLAGTVHFYTGTYALTNAIKLVQHHVSTTASKSTKFQFICNNINLMVICTPACH